MGEDLTSVDPVAVEAERYAAGDFGACDRALVHRLGVEHHEIAARLAGDVLYGDDPAIALRRILGARDETGLLQGAGRPGPPVTFRAGLQVLEEQAVHRRTAGAAADRIDRALEVDLEPPGVAVLAAHEAIVDARNLFDFANGITTEEGLFMLNAQRRMLRGGIQVRF